ncbi:MAG: exo-alpha-sialidase [Verrucomicrobia bacterium]|nr:exo-alpha-sialidase [Verrucomicrobiota bacterium]
MNMIEYVESHILYENPRPHVRSRHGYFPGVVQLPSPAEGGPAGELLALLVIGEAFESADQTTYVSRSKDLGKTWELQGPLYDKSVDTVRTSDYLKPQILRDGTLIALGYRFHRHDPEQPILDDKTNCWLSGDDIVSFSRDHGRTWTVPQAIARSIPELLEIPSRCLQLRSGDIVATAGLFPMPDGTNPSGQFGVLLRSVDGGKTWNDKTHFFETPTKTVAAYESHICEMQDGRLAAIAWANDVAADKSLPNQVAVSHDNGHTWSEPINTGHKGQSSNLLWLGGDRLLSIHCHRGEEVGLYVRVIDFSKDRWNIIAEKVVWGPSVGPQTGREQPFVPLLKSIRFGQASLLRLSNGEILATHWSIEEGQGKIRVHRLRVRDS